MSIHSWQKINLTPNYENKDKKCYFNKLNIIIQKL
jgi:hypothetical protein